ncbi:unnamed protein product, partial [Meganyctiphanes norvegica]
GTEVELFFNSMSLHFRPRQKNITVITAIFTFLSAVLLFAGIVTYVVDINQALTVCWRQIRDNLPWCGPEEENCAEKFRYYEASCYYNSNEDLLMAVALLLFLGGIFTIIALSCFCYSVNLSNPPSKKCCNNGCLWKGWVSLATIGALFAVYSLSLFVKFSHHPAANRPPAENDGVTYALTIMGASVFLAVGVLMAIIGLVLLCFIRTGKADTDYKDVDEEINI